MSKPFSYSRVKPYRLDTLHDDLLAAGIAVETIYSVNNERNDIRVIVGNNQVKSAVDVVVLAHDETKRPQYEIDFETDTVDLVTLRSTAVAIITRSNQIENQMDAIKAANITTIAAASTAIKTEADAIKDLAIGIRRLTKALGVILKRAGVKDF